MLTTSSISIINVNDGKDGTGIQRSETTYAVGYSGVIPPGDQLTDEHGELITDHNGEILINGNGNWSETIPTVPPGMYLWTRTILYFEDDDSEIIYSVSKDGLTQKRVREQWYLSTSNEELTGGTWSYEEPSSIPDGKYLWGRLEMIMDNGSIQYSDAVYRSTMDGVISEVDKANLAITNKVWQTDITTSINSYDGSTGKDIRDRMTNVEQDLDGITQQVLDIETTTDPVTGDVTYMSSRISTVEQTADKIGWVVKSGSSASNMEMTDEAIALISENIDLTGKVTFNSFDTILKNRMETAEDDASTAKSDASTAKTNAASALSAVNNSVKETTMHYLATSASSGVTKSTPGWTDTIQSITSTDRYLWTYQTVTKINDTTYDTDPVISGVWGNPGTPGGQGATGVGVSKVEQLYRTSNSTTAPAKPSSVISSISTSANTWTLAMPAYNTSYPYYYTCTQTTYTNGNHTWTDVVRSKAIEDANTTANTANANASNAVTTANNAKTSADNAKAWIDTNGTAVVNAADIVDSWKGEAVSGQTTINGGLIQTNTILAKHLATNAIMSENYSSGISGFEKTRPATQFSYTGSFLDLADGNFYTPNFGVINTTWSDGPDIGAFINGKIIATSGKIGGFTLGTESMYSSSNNPATENNFYLMPTGSQSTTYKIAGSELLNNWVMTSGTTFGVTKTGAMYSNSGKIGGWTITTDAIYNKTNSMTSTAKGLYLGTSGIRNYESDTKYVNITGGVITAFGANISGVLKAGANSKIGPWTITNTSIYKTNATWGNATTGAAYFGNNGISITNKFKVSATGELTATSGHVGGWNIDGGSINSTTSTTDPKTDGNTVWIVSDVNNHDFLVVAEHSTDGDSYPFWVRKDGTIYAERGTIGGFTLDSSFLTASSTDYAVWLRDGSNALKDFIVVRTGTSGSYKYPFYVRATGEMKAENASITGTIKANTLSVSEKLTIYKSGFSTAQTCIGGFNNALFLGGYMDANNNLISVGNGVYVFGTNGITLNGPIYANNQTVNATLCDTGVAARAGKYIHGLSGRATIFSSGQGNSGAFNALFCIEGPTGNWAGGVINSATNYVLCYSTSSHIADGTNAPDAMYTFGKDGTLTCKKLTQSSDIRLKENIKKCNINALDAVHKMDVRQFDWKDGSGHEEIGFVADELETINPNLVQGGGYDEAGNMIVKSIDTMRLLSYAIKAIQEQQEEIESLKKQLASM